MVRVSILRIYSIFCSTSSAAEASFLTQTPRFVKDVLNIIADHHSFTETAVNEKLGRLGWGEHILDGYILELIRFLSENHKNLSPHISAPPLPVSPCAGRAIGEASQG